MDDDDEVVAQILEYHHDVLARRSVGKLSGSPVEAL